MIERFTDKISDKTLSKHFKVALAGNANVGKSVIFNFFTGLHQHIGNWPGKTIERAEGTLVYKGYTIDVLDLPGVYSLSTFSAEELITRDYIVNETPDFVINVVDASILERNLFFTIQLLELGKPMVMALNQIDVARAKGMRIDHRKLEKYLGIPVIPTIATKEHGLHDLLEKCIDIRKGNVSIKSVEIKYGREIEERIEKLSNLLKPLPIKYPARYTAIKLLEGDDEIKRIVGSVDSKVIEHARQYASELERIHGEKCYVVISAERYNIAHKIVSGCEEEVALPQKLTLSEKLDALTTHKFFGYIIMIAILLAIFFAIFTAGAFLSDVISNLFNALKPTVAVKSAENILWETVFGGFVAGVTLVIPFVLPFYFVLSVLEDTGYLTRIAFLLDSVMHRIGLHGKALIPIIFGYGCSVPACYSCRIMESKRDRFITAFIITLIPCTARGIVIFGLVGAFVGIHWAFLLYAINICIAFALARCAFRILPGEPVGLIMEMHPYKLPSLKTVFKKTWWRLKSLFILVFPIYIAGGAIIGIMHISGSLTYIENALSPITVGWFGLPAITSVLLIFGLVRKELIIIMPAILIGTTDLNTVFTDVQMVVLAFIAMLYAPCIATVGALKKEFGWKKSFAIVVFEIIFAIIIGGIAYRIFDLIL